jgi:hypothetical protein
MYKTVEIHYSQSRKEKDHRKMKHCVHTDSLQCDPTPYFSTLVRPPASSSSDQGTSPLSGVHSSAVLQHISTVSNIQVQSSTLVTGPTIITLLVPPLSSE